MRERRWPFGGMTTTPFDRTAHSIICRQPPTPKSPLLECNGTGRLRYAGAPRPVPLHHRAIRAQMKPGLYSSADEAWGSGHLDEIERKLDRIMEEPGSYSHRLFGTQGQSSKGGLNNDQNKQLWKMV